VPPKDPIPLEVLKQKAENYALQRRNAYLTSGLIRQDEKPPRPKRNGAVTGYSRPSVVDTDDNGFDTVTVTEANQMVFFQGMRIAVPRSMRNRRFHRPVTESELGFWDVEDGELVLSIPLPVVARYRKDEGVHQLLQHQRRVDEGSIQTIATQTRKSPKAILHH